MAASRSSRSPVLQAIITREPRQIFLPHPFIDNATDILTRNAGHCCEIALCDLLLDQNLTGPDVLPECFRETSSACATRPFSDRKLIAATTLLVSRSRRTSSRTMST